MLYLRQGTSLVASMLATGVHLHPCQLLTSAYCPAVLLLCHCCPCTAAHALLPAPLWQGPSTPSKAAARARQAEKHDLRTMLVGRLQHELTTGVESSIVQRQQHPLLALLGPGGAGLGLGVGGAGICLFSAPIAQINASACYQAVFR